MNIYYDYDLVYANWNILIGINRSEGAGFEPASRAAARRTDCKSAAMDLAMRPLHVRRVGGFEPPRRKYVSGFPVRRVCQLRHTRIEEAAGSFYSSCRFLFSAYYKNFKA